MITAIILSFFGASFLASLLVLAACVASSRAAQIQPGSMVDSEQFVAVDGQPAVATPQLTLVTSSV